MKKLELTQMENLQGGDGTSDWCDAINGLGGADYINSLQRPEQVGGYIAALWLRYC